MNNYIKFDTEKFLKDSRGWADKMKELEQELESITEISGHTEGAPSGGGVSSPTERTAVERDAIQRQIDTIREYMDCFKYAWDCASEDDKLILKGFYFAPGYIYRFVEYWCEENASNRDYCYKAKRETEQRFGEACRRWMKEHGYDT